MPLPRKSNTEYQRHILPLPRQSAFMRTLASSCRELFGLSNEMTSLLSPLLLFLLVCFAHCHIPTTLEGPFDPVTVQFDPALRGVALDLPDTDPRVLRRVKGFEPEQISLSLSTTHDSVWVSWITGISFN